MNRYYDDDFENALECARRMTYSDKAKNVLIYAPWWIRLDIYDDFEKMPELTEAAFMALFSQRVFKNSILFEKRIRIKDTDKTDKTEKTDQTKETTSS